MTRVRGEADAVRVERVSVRWCVEPSAARAALEGGTPDGNGAGVSAIELSLRRDGCDAGGAWVGQVVVESGGERRRVRRRPGLSVRCVPDSVHGMMHIDADGFVSATVDVSAGVPGALLYVRSPVLADLGFAGGRYEPSGVTLDVCPDVPGRS